jgi:hypothetical protein
LSHIWARRDEGDGIDVIEPAESDRTNVVDLMPPLKKSLAQEAAEGPWHN